MHHLAITGESRTATLLIHPANVRSQALAERTRFVRQPDFDGHPYSKRPVPSLTYRHRDVTIRGRHPDDLEMDLTGRDDEHMRWLWQPNEVEQWEAMTPSERRAHAHRWLALRFLREHTSTRRAHLMVDPDDRPSLAVAAGVGATVGALTVDRHGRSSLRRHSLALDLDEPVERLD